MSVKSIFDLKTSNQDLSSANQGLTNYRYQEIQALKSTSYTNFSGGEQTYRWTYGSNRWFLPGRSYMRIRAKLKLKEKANLKGITPAMNMGNCIFSNAQFKIADQIVCNISDNLTQTATMKERLSKSGHWLNTYGADTNFWDAEPDERMKKLRSISIKEDEYVVSKTLEQMITELKLIGLSNEQKFTLDPVGRKLKFEWIQTALIPADKKELFANYPHLFTHGFRYEITFEKKELDLMLTKLESGIGTYPPATGTTPSTTGVTTNRVTFDILNTGNLTPDSGTLEVRGEYFNAPIKNLKFGMASKSNFNDIETFEIYWKPPLSVFDLKSALPCASSKYELTLTPYPDGTWEKRAVESLISAEHKIDYDIEIQDIKLYLLVCDSNPIKDTFNFFLDLDELDTQTIQITSSNESKSLDVKESTVALAIAMQDEDTGTNSVYSPSIFRVRNNIQHKLSRFYIRYDGSQKPSPDWEGQMGDAIDTVKGLYNRTLLYNGLALDNGATETYNEFKQRGIYAYIPYPKTASSRATRAYIQTNFRDNVIGEKTVAGKAQPKLLLFDFYKKVVICDVNNGRITRVSPIDA